LKSGLLRVQRLRQLLEERAGLDLQTKAAELRRLEAEAEEQRRLAGQVRSEVLQDQPGHDGNDSWLGMADAEIFAWRSRRMKTAAHGVSEEVAALHEIRMLRRIERRQAERLVLGLEQAQTQERNRREQHHLDDWFQNRPPSGPRHSS